MNEKELKDLIHKYLSGNASAEEERFLDRFFAKVDGEASAQDLSKDIELRERLFGEIRSKMQPASSRFHPKKLLRYAAIFLAVLGTSLFTYLAIRGDNTPRVNFENAVVLETATGDFFNLSDEDFFELKGTNGQRYASKQGLELYYTKEVYPGSAEYHTIRVPYAKEFSLTLSDGTRVQLNSGSSITYPAQFFKGERRNVMLKGEAYFEVAHDTQRPFVVHTDNMDLQVLGTKFNLKAYPDEDMTYTALVEGSVQVYDPRKERPEQNAQVLRPGQLAAWSNHSKQAEIHSVDLEAYTAWMDGRLVFVSMPFNHIVKVLERTYNVQIVNKAIAYEDQKFTASFKRQSLEEVLEVFREGYGLQYSRKNNIITIHPKSNEPMN